jgi:tetratricopeptide (TPR) repeat protein
MRWYNVTFWLFSCLFLFSFNLKDTKNKFYSSTKDKLIYAEKLRDFYLDESPDSIFNLGNHLFIEGIKSENTNWLTFGKLLIASYYTKKGKTEISKNYLKECIKFYEHQKDYLRIADAYNLLALAYFYEANYQKAIQNFQKSIETSNLLPLNDEAFTAQITLAETYIILEKYDLAEKEIRSFLKKVTTLKLDKGLRKGYSVLAKIYLYNDQSKKAFEYYNKALKLAFKSGDKLGLSTAYNNVAIAYFEVNNIEKSKEYFEKSLKLRLEMNYPKTICESYYNLAEIAFQEKKYDDALNYLQKNMEVATDHELLSEKIDAIERIIEILKLKGNKDKVIELYEQLVTIKRKQQKIIYKEELENEVTYKNNELFEAKLFQDIREKELIKRIDELQRKQNYFYISFFVFIALIIVVIYYSRKKND